MVVDSELPVTGTEETKGTATAAVEDWAGMEGREEMWLSS